MCLGEKTVYQSFPLVPGQVKATTTTTQTHHVSAFFFLSFFLFSLFSLDTYRTSNDLLRTLERQNLKLQQDVDRTVTEVEQWQSEVLALEADDAALEVKMDGLWAALERHKTEHPLEHSLATVREDLQAYMADTHRRIMQRQHGSFAWERSFERLYRFQAAAQGRSVWLSWLALLALAGLVLLIYRSPLDVNYN